MVIHTLFPASANANVSSSIKIYKPLWCPRWTCFSSCSNGMQCFYVHSPDIV